MFDDVSSEEEEPPKKKVIFIISILIISNAPITLGVCLTVWPGKQQSYLKLQRWRVCENSMVRRVAAGGESLPAAGWMV